MTDECDDVKHALTTALEALSKQEERIEEYHKQSLRWHRQHHEAIAAIGEVIERFRFTLEAGSINTNTNTAVDDKDVISNTVVDSSFRDKLLIALNSGCDVRTLLVSVGLNQYKTIGTLGFQKLLPTLILWLQDPVIAYNSLVMLYEGVKMWGEVLTQPVMTTIVNDLITQLRRLTRNPIGKVGNYRDDVVDLLRVVEGFVSMNPMQ